MVPSTPNRLPTQLLRNPVMPDFQLKHDLAQVQVKEMAKDHPCYGFGDLIP